MRTPGLGLWLSLGLIVPVTAASDPHVVESDSVSTIAFPGHDTRLLAGWHTTPAGAAVLALEVPALTFGAPPHVHEREDEFFYVLEGQVEFLDRERTISAGAGALVVLPRGNLHGFWNASDEPARMLLVITPGEFASFFDEVVAQIRERNLSDPAQVGALIAETAERHDVRVYPDRIPESARALLPSP